MTLGRCPRCGSGLFLTVLAVDAAGGPEPAAGWKARLRCTDARAEFPAVVESNPANPGEPAHATIRFRTAGIHTFGATDLADPARVGTSTVLVLPAETARFRVTAPGAVAAGERFTLVVAAVDGFDNPTPEYGGLMRLAVTDDRATLLPDPRPADGDGGARSFQVTLSTPGSHTFTASDGARPELSTRLTVTVGPRAKP